ncbi:MAG TPA: DNA repair protein RecN [Gammaproteobacteria bacterium]|nr:DNA repair protein RecN [Gammaproteobacteria bacterium]
MLTALQIRDFALVEQVDLELQQGMSVLTGETGAGKSILLDALGLCLGNRADSGLIRHGAKRAEIGIEFELGDRPEVWQWLVEHDLEEETACQIRRVITSDGRSRGYINGRPATLQQMRELGEMLVDIHGQHEHQSLMRRGMQRQLLDGYGGHRQPLERLAQLRRRWQELNERLARLQGAGQERDARMDLLRYQIQELEALSLAQGEVAELEREHHRLANASQLLGECRQALELLHESEEGSVSTLLARIVRLLEPLQEMDESLRGVLELLNGASIQVEEAAGELHRGIAAIELNPQRLQWVEERLATIHQLARKHRLELEELPALLPQLQQELLELEQSETRSRELRDELNALLAEYDEVASELTGRRREAARRLGKAVTGNMQQLGMEGGRFEIRLVPQESGEPSAFGREQVEFWVAANPGQPLQPLAKVASGGELARISLAIQVVTAQSASIPTLVFDEVDVGIGGGVAEIVGRQLRTLGRHCQVICVTHQPQVAAQAHHHLLVSKQSGDGGTSTAVHPLSREQRVEELARMLGGVKITGQTISHAREMMERGQASG